MGEVYRAKDTKLSREVALKILPATFTNDPDRVARFRREAQVLASLNHPHIGAIYGLDEANSTQFLVLELVDGESLDKRIARGRIPVAEALGIAKQIAEALEAAHEKGIIHRDLKPANIALTRDGAVKVLDFGLAKAVDAIPAFDLTQSPTVTFDGTRAGVLLGTAPYMSPQQARGQPVDKRTDIWAFGCVLFEMLVGFQPFSGETISDTIAAILEREAAWDRLPRTTPQGVRHLLHGCLEKDLKRRLRDIGDARIELDDVSSRVHADEPDPPVRRVSPFRVVAASAAVLIVSVGISGWRWHAPLSSSGPILTRLTWDTGLTTDPALSADGKLLAYSSDWAAEGNLDI